MVFKCDYCIKFTNVILCEYCNQAKYCSIECKGKDWNYHRPHCKFMEIESLVSKQVSKLNFTIFKREYDDNTWKYIRRASKNHDIFCEKYILLESDCGEIIEIIENDISDDDYSVDLDSNDDWMSDLDDYNTEDDSDYIEEE